MSPERKLIHLKAASTFFESLLIARPFAKKCVALLVLPGSTAMSQLKSQLSLNVEKAQVLGQELREEERGRD